MVGGGSELVNIGYMEREKRRKRWSELGRRFLDIATNGQGEKVEKEQKEYLLVENMEMPKNNSDYFKELYEDWDEAGAKIPYKLGVLLEALVNDKNYWFGVHRSDSIDGKKIENDKILQKIMTEGLKNAGDASSGAFYKNPPVSKTVSKCNNMLHVAINLKGSYKRSTGAVLVAVPSKYLDENGYVKPGMEDKVYNTDEFGLSVIKPEYLVGFVQSLGEGTTMRFKTREEILKTAKTSEG